MIKDGLDGACTSAVERASGSPKSDRQQRIFVFGSNLAGRHGAGAAKWARENRGAIYGQGVGLQGNSYAIPTKDHRLGVMPVDAIAFHVRTFIRFARDNPGLRFELTPVGCGLAGYDPKDIGPLFDGAPANVDLPAAFKPFILPAASLDEPAVPLR